MLEDIASAPAERGTDAFPDTRLLRRATKLGPPRMESLGLNGSETVGEIKAWCRSRRSRRGHKKLVKELWVRGRCVLSRKEKYVGRYIR